MSVLNRIPYFCLYSDYLSSSDALDYSLVVAQHGRWFRSFPSAYQSATHIIEQKKEKKRGWGSMYNSMANISWPSSQASERKSLVWRIVLWVVREGSEPARLFLHPPKKERNELEIIICLATEMIRSISSKMVWTYCSDRNLVLFDSLKKNERILFVYTLRFSFPKNCVHKKR